MRKEKGKDKRKDQTHTPYNVEKTPKYDSLAGKDTEMQQKQKAPMQPPKQYEIKRLM